MSSEHDEQVQLFVWAFRQRNVYPALNMMYAIPNGGKRERVTAARLKAEGVKAGVPDICLAYPVGKYHGLYLELKYGKNTASEAQAEWLEALTNQGYCAAIAWGFEDARRVIVDYLEGRL